ncbi:preprotein translocase subunit SecE [Neoactinobaculum massilliense]|uniref:preprotein translocase subunit SecE n=1 Tax=Neoactinobaculum massilliense TaxID=2364794 RepID=UPI000F52364F|nr:preprotein translocase subunit SecE [Neoactinobaculum massilliense]
MSGKSASTRASKLNVFQRLAQFFREILVELKKVQAPTRSELGQMFLTVVVFIAVVMLFVWLVDLLFGQLALWIFG